ncbi:MAG TPA: hypothetical protein VM513_19135 [Kofleriaceae bacterium]|nr:hypothetical protein [Kofleriaceae bacterium]
MRVVMLLAVIAALGACSKRTSSRELSLDAIRVTGDFKVRTDTVGDGAHASTSTFLLVDAENTAGQGAYVTLAGALVDASGATVGQLKPQSLWIPSGERRTFALVDTERAARPTSTSARIEVKGAKVPDDPPRARIEQLHVFDDYGKTVVQANLVNDAERTGQIMVVAAFHDANGQPMTRPFEMMQIGGKQTRAVQFVGPLGSKTGTIFVGDVIY